MFDDIIKKKRRLLKATWTFELKQEDELWDADPNCKHDIKCAAGGGVKCTKCGGWFCY